MELKIVLVISVPAIVIKDSKEGEILSKQIGERILSMKFKKNLRKYKAAWRSNMEIKITEKQHLKKEDCWEVVKTLFKTSNERMINCLIILANWAICLIWFPTMFGGKILKEGVEELLLTVIIYMVIFAEYLYMDKTF